MTQFHTLIAGVFPLSNCFNALALQETWEDVYDLVGGQFTEGSGQLAAIKSGSGLIHLACAYPDYAVHANTLRLSVLESVDGTNWLTSHDNLELTPNHIYPGNGTAGQTAEPLRVMMPLWTVRMETPPASPPQNEIRIITGIVRWT